MASPIPQATCGECLKSASEPLSTLSGIFLCGSCADLFYLACAGCGGLLPREEVRLHDDRNYCEACLIQAVSPDVTPPTDDELKELIAEYVSLKGEEKKLKTRLDNLNERIKLAAAIKRRDEKSVTLTGTSGAVKCTYSISLKCDPERVEALAPLLAPDLFERLFEREIKYKSRPKTINELMASLDTADETILTLVKEAVTENETATLRLASTGAGRN